MKITVLVENTTSADNLACEHGLSLYIEHDGRKILLDAGSTDIFLDNADKLGIDLADTDICVLSHGHYDHSGGFAQLLERHPHLRVYAHKTAFDSYHSENGGLHKIGIPADVTAHRDKFIPTDSVTEISEGIFLVPHNTAGLDSIGRQARLLRMDNGELSPDDFRHEQSLVITAPDGLVIFNSCSHGGVEAIINEAMAAVPCKRLLAYIGGLHMKGSRDGREVCAFSDERINALCRVITDSAMTVYTGHCTGSAGFDELHSRLGDAVRPLSTGIIINI